MQWLHGCWALGQAPNRRWGAQILEVALRNCSKCSVLSHTLCCVTSLTISSALITGSQQMVKSNHPQGCDMTRRKEDGNWNLLLMLCKLKEYYPQDRALGIRDLKQGIWKEAMVGNLEGGRIIFWHNSVLKQFLSICNHYSLCSKLSLSTLEFSAFRYSQRLSLSAMAFTKQWMQLNNL